MTGMGNGHDNTQRQARRTTGMGTHDDRDGHTRMGTQQEGWMGMTGMGNGHTIRGMERQDRDGHTMRGMDGHDRDGQWAHNRDGWA